MFVVYFVQATYGGNKNKLYLVSKFDNRCCYFFSKHNSDLNIILIYTDAVSSKSIIQKLYTCIIVTSSIKSLDCR